MPRDNSPGVVVLDIYSGNGKHGHTIWDSLRQHLVAEGGSHGGFYRVPITLLSIDFAPPANAAYPPYFQCNVFAFSESNMRLLKSRFPRKKVRCYLDTMYHYLI